MKTVEEPAREIEVIREADVVVVGGGTAGLAAAVAAARTGADTLLVERYGCLGGMMTAGLVAMIPGVKEYEKGTPVYGGIMTEICERLRTYDAVWDMSGQGRVLHWDPEVLKFVSIEMIEEAGVKLRLHSWAVNALTEASHISAVILESKAGRQAVLAKAVVDCSGDGDLAEFAQAPFELAGQNISIMEKLAGIDEEITAAYLREHGKEFTEKLEARGINFSRGGPIYKLLRGVRLCHGAHLDTSHLGEDAAINPESLTWLEVELRKATVRSLEFLRKNLPGFENVVLLETASQIGTRQSRRITGDYILTIDDVRSGRHFDDVVCRLGRRDKIYEVPYRSLYSKTIENLFVGGRCISTTREAHGPIRLIPQCVLTGQAAGTAAALAIHDGRPAREVAITELQSTLRKNDVPLG